MQKITEILSPKLHNQVVSIHNDHKLTVNRKTQLHLSYLLVKSLLLHKLDMYSILR